MSSAIIKVANCVNRLVLWFRRGQRIKPRAGTVKVNIGAGLSVAQGWINVDSNPHAVVSRLPACMVKGIYQLSSVRNQYSRKEYFDLLKEHIFIPHNLEYGIPFSDDSVDFLYSSHLLEHLFREDAAGLLKEAYRVLKKGGIIRMGVPDLKYAMSLYHEGNKQKALSLFFTGMKSSDRFDNHRYMYDFDMLNSLLIESGFTGIEKCSYRQGKVPDIDKLDNRPDETLFIEAVK